MVTPPANGRKLWRVPRKQLTTSNPEHNSYQECLNNSLKIVAAGKAYLTKRPPLRRPKNQPGKPKDFVFVDLSPIRTEEANTKETVNKDLTVSNISPLSDTCNDSFSVSSDEESMLSLYDTTIYNESNDINEFSNDFNNYTMQQSQSFSAPLQDMTGLGFSMKDFQFDMSTLHTNINPYPEQEHAQLHQSQILDFTTPQRAITANVTTPERKRAVSSAFEYATPTPRKRNRHSLDSTPNLAGLEAFMILNDSIASPVNRAIPQNVQQFVPRGVSTAANAYNMHVRPNSTNFSPISDDSEVEEFHQIKLDKPINFSNFEDSLSKPSFDLNAFIAF